MDGGGGRGLARANKQLEAISIRAKRTAHHAASCAKLSWVRQSTEWLPKGWRFKGRRPSLVTSFLPQEKFYAQSSKNER